MCKKVSHISLCALKEANARDLKCNTLKDIWGPTITMTQLTAYPKQFNKIILTLENCLLPETKLDETPSQQDGLDKETETDLRILGCELIQTAGILLKLPQVRQIIHLSIRHIYVYADFVTGCNGYWTGDLSAILLFEVVCASQHGDYRHELYLPGVQN